MVANANALEDIYELSPMQRGMLFHTLYAPHSGVYMEQAILSIQGSLDFGAFREAWQRVVARHATLRTAFLWEELDEPMQVVYQDARVPWERLDWREFSPTAQQARLEDLLATDRMRGFDLAEPPLLRLIMVRVSSDTHYLILTHHHLLLDGWSLNIVLQEVWGAYRALRGGSGEPQFKARRPYRDYIAWLQRQNLAEAEAFWRNYLLGFVAPTPLLLDRVGRAEGEKLDDGVAPENTVALEDREELRLRGGRPVELRGFTLSRETSAALRAFARQHQLTMNTLLQGAWALLLSRYSVGSDQPPDGGADVVFGSTVAGRPADLSGAEAMVGLFINTLPVRVRIPAQTDLLSWLVQLQAQQVEARQYEFTPLVQVHGWSEVPRGQSLFESLVVFENYHAEDWDEGGGEATEAPGRLQVRALQALEQTNYPLVLIIMPGAELEIQLGYETARFTPGAIRHALDALRMLLEGFMAGPQTRLADISLLSAAERERLLTRWHQAEAESAYPQDVTLMQLFQEQVARTPDAPALSFYARENQQGKGEPGHVPSLLTYAELDRRANQLARYLQSAGVGPEVPVGLCLERSLDLMIGLLGILKAGGVYMPLDPGYPQERLAFMLTSTQGDPQQPLVVLIQRQLLSRLPATFARIICIDNERLAIAQERVEPLPIHVQPAHAAYIIYTSGSAGAPKGVVVTQRSLVNHCLALGKRYALETGDRVLQFASISFDVAIEELFPTWLYGAAVVMWPESVAPAPAEFSRFVASEQLTVLNLPSSYWHEWVSELTRPRAQRPTSVRLMIVGSEKVSSSHFNAWRDVMGTHIVWCNAYGLTETTITSLIYEPTGAGVQEQNASIPIGQPVANARAYVLDTQVQPVPMGMPGELYIGGAGLARGYLRRPELTAERFVPDSFGNLAGARLYRTGDLVRYREDGNLEFLGRVDSQVKLRGYRIELGEVEAQLHQHAAVGDVVVLAREDTPNDTRLVAYIVPAGRSAPLTLPAQLQTYLQDRLPAYMVPTAFVLLDTFPRGPSGKVNPRALPAPERLHASADETYSAPRTPLEEILAGIWAAVLRLELVGRADNFFKLGGHSLQATQVVARLREVLQIELPVRAIYDAPTIVAQATSIEKLRLSAKSLVMPPFQRVDRERLLPLSFAQQRLWFLDQLQADSPLYNIPGSFYIREALNVAALEQSLNALVQRHEPLRTTFATHHEQPVQIIAPVLYLPLPVVDLSGLADPTTRDAEIERLARQEAERPFHLQRGPLVRVMLLRLNVREHVLLLTLQHIVADGWSADIFFDELNAYYAASVTGVPARLPELPIQYADYAVWQEGWLRGEALEQLLAYWRTQLSGIPPTLDLPTDHPRPAMQTFHGVRHRFGLSLILTTQLKALSQQEGVTLFMTLLAALQVLLARYSGQTDIVIGTPIAGRTHVEVERLIGFFVNTLVLRSDLADNPHFKEALVRVREMALAAYTYQDLPFEKLVEELHPERSLSQSPIFQVLFVLHNLTSNGASRKAPGLNLEQLEIDSGTAKFDLSFELVETSLSIEGYIEYNTDLFEAATIQRMAVHYTTLLESIVANPEQRIAALPLLTSAENRQILEEWNATREVYPQNMCLHALFEAQEAQTPDRVAVIFEDQQVTYRTLNERANQLAHTLQGLGVGPDAPVGLCLERSIEMIVGVLGILKAGGVYVPLDPGYPSHRLAFLVADTHMPVLITLQRLLERLPLKARQQLPGQHPRVLCLDAEWQSLAAQPITRPQSVVRPDHLAYIIYTSGSTGVPKGVAMPHAPLVNLFTWQQSVSKLHPGARTLQFASLNFDVASQEIFCTVGFGHTLVLLTEDLRRDPAAMLALLVEEAVERLFLPVVALQQLAEVSVACEVGRVPSVLREVITAGEQLQITPQVIKLFEQLPGTLLYNQYGPSESHVVSYYRLEGPPSCWPTLPPIGRPIANSELYVLDRHMQPVPVGVPGELYLGGRGIARGYLARPDWTAERFVPHPFSHSAGARLYRTGDQVRYRVDGNLEFLGRLDQQVKVRGFRVEPGEIEAELGRHPDVQEVVVLVREDTPADKRLVAYVVTAQTSTPVSAASLRHYLQGQLPGYMVPAHIVLLERLPLTPNGKVDRRALPAPEATERAPGDASSAAHTLVQEVLIAIWADILHVEHAGVQDNFFELGGHSLLATRAIARIREAYNVDIPLRVVFEASTLADLAARIEAARGDTMQALEIPPLVPRPAGSALPLSYAQERLWFLNQLEPESPAYNVPVALRVQGALDSAALQESLNILALRHETLRTSFAVIDSQPQQVIAPLSRITLRTRDLGSARSELQRLAAQEIVQPFDLSRGPLMRALLLQLDEDEHILLLTMHHSITDGWSTSIVVNELDAIYRTLVSRTPFVLPALPIQYADYAAWQRQWLRGEVLERQVAYWRRQLLNAPTVLDLPTDHPRPATQTYRGNTCFFALSPALSRELQVLSRREAVTLFMTLLAAFQALLLRYSGQTDIVVGTPIAGRTRGETEGLIGLFINTLALRTDLAGNPAFRTLLGRVREVCLEAYTHQDVPFEKVIEAVQPERSLSHHPLFQVMFILQNTPIGVQFIAPEPDESATLRPYPLALGEAATKFDLTVELVESPEGLHGIVEYTTDLFERETIERLIQHYQRLLAEIVANPDERLSRLPLLAEDEQRRLLFDWNATASDELSGLCVQQLFEAQVVRSPNAVALAYEGRSGEGKTLSYAELNRRANQLAHMLRAKGVRPEVVVGLYMERAPELVVAVLGILKTGGAYVPLDTAHPKERLAFMLQETRAPILLTQQRLLHKLPAYSGLVVSLDSDQGLLAEEDSADLVGEATATSLAYVIYTSGSTGLPKGVMITHGGLTNYLRWCVQAYRVEQGQGSLLHSSLASDLSVTSLFAPLLVGQRVTLLSEAQGIDALGSALRQIRDRSLVKLTPAHLTLLAGQLATEDVSGRANALIIGGEALLQEHVTFWQAHAPETRLINEYGPTETVVGCCVYELEADSQHPDRGPVPIGRPIANTQLYLLDWELQPVPVGVRGELYIAGAGVARGYLQRPDLTAERFLPDPFSKEPGARFYRTGDLARYIGGSKGANIEFLGRNDEQVKLRGYRVELGEIEAALKGYAEVQEAVVLLEEGALAVSGEKHLVAYLVAQHNATLAVGDVRVYLRERLPDYMVPTFYVVLDALPLLPNGKVDRHALLVIGQSREEPERAGGEPRDPVEEMLVSIWAEVLGREQVSIYDNFFDLGGHSLLITQVISRVRESLQVELPLRTLFEKPTIAEFAEAVIQQEFGQADSDELRQLLAELEELSPDEIETMNQP